MMVMYVCTGETMDLRWVIIPPLLNGVHVSDLPLSSVKLVAICHRSFSFVVNVSYI